MYFRSFSKTGAGSRQTIPLSPLAATLARKGIASGRRLAEIELGAERFDTPLPEILARSLFLSSDTLAEAEAETLGAGLVDPLAEPPDPNLLARLGADQALQLGLLPWRRVGGGTIILAARPEGFSRALPYLTKLFGSVRLAVATASQIDATIVAMASRELVARAEALPPARLSARGWPGRKGIIVAVAAGALLASIAAFAPKWGLFLAIGWALTTLILNMGLKIAAAVAALSRPIGPVRETPLPKRLPVVSLLVPLYKEREIANHLLRRLSAIDYPAPLLDVILLLEADDHLTHETLAAANLPRWMRAITVPGGTIKTKPRALNYGLNFARGRIVGIYDAEDAPAPDQIRKIVARFAARGPEVACLQGILDYYNSRANWLARCFTLEYAAWFRVVLPGMARLGLTIPLGGTTVFFRRSVLDQIGGWDAHNVTEDADLGLRLARFGYRTELVDTVTGEEANCRAWPWVRQRSRWLKGYAVTYGVHMRNPLRLLRDLGPWRFFGVQILFFGTLSQFALAPALWSFWLILLGLPHPLAGLLPPAAFISLSTLFVMSEMTNLVVAVLAARRAGKGWLAPWAITLQAYFPLATLAAYKGLLEILWRPFFWDKTAHGHSITAPEAGLRHSVPLTPHQA
jgi:cellulose synthase/poly-beta-1,6-N-acetylglucosamine synthase-like glycosyltransferase